MSRYLRNHVFRTGVALASLLAACVTGCHSNRPSGPSVQITHVPQADPGGPAKLDYIQGTVSGAQPGQEIVLYAHSGIWWVQPFANQTATKILPDNTWKNSTHLGTDYAALLVDPGYHPPSRITDLPKVGNGIFAVAVARGKAAAPVVSKIIHFSGYDWQVRTASSDRGGTANLFDASNVWTDDKGFLHLRMFEKDGGWHCAEVNLMHSLGYGTYRFVLEDNSGIDPSAVVDLFTWDDIRSEGFRNELDIELSRWGDAKGLNAQYVVQPFYVAENVARFMAPPGVLTHTFRWEPDKLTFMTYRGASARSGERPVFEHTFTSGIPVPAAETVHMDLYKFHHVKVPSHQPAEVVIEKFEYLP